MSAHTDIPHLLPNRRLREQVGVLVAACLLTGTDWWPDQIDWTALSMPPHFVFPPAPVIRKSWVEEAGEHAPTLNVVPEAASMQVLPEAVMEKLPAGGGGTGGGGAGGRGAGGGHGLNGG